MDLIDQRFLAYENFLGIIGLVSIFFLGLTIIETVWDFYKTKRQRYGETATNIGIFIVNTALERTLYGSLFVILLYFVEPFRAWVMPHTWWSMVLAIIAADFSYYWMHRIEHEVRILWAYHSVHHSSSEYNLTTAMRLAWVEGLFEWVFFVPMILIGFDVVQTTLALLTVVIYQTWIHTQKIGKLGWLDTVFNTPSVHRVHHGSNAQYIDKNYGGILIIWDRLFGTYEAENEKVVFGITEPPHSINPIKVNFFEFGRILKDAWQAKSLGHAFGFIFKGPGWKPNKNEIRKGE